MPVANAVRTMSMPETMTTMVVAVAVSMAMRVPNAVRNGVADDACCAMWVTAVRFSSAGHRHETRHCRDQNQETHIASSKSVDL